MNSTELDIDIHPNHTGPLDPFPRLIGPNEELPRQIYPPSSVASVTVLSERDYH
jgi:hypothetical protein